MELFRHTVLTPEILAEIRQLHFQTRRLASEGLSGQYRSAFRGQGMEFEEVREYRPGDDIRSIDWKVTARRRIPYVKSFREERELTVMIAVDISASSATGTRHQLRETLLARVGAVLTLIALQNNDHVGLVTFSDSIETYHPPRKARGAVWRILHEVLGGLQESSLRPTTSKTSLSGVFSFLNSVLKRRAIIFILSDFMDQGFETALGTLAKRHDLTAIMASDPADLELPRAGLVLLRNAETNELVLIDTSNELVRREYHNKAAEQRSKLLSLFNRYRIDLLEMPTNSPFMPVIKNYFDCRATGVRNKNAKLSA